MTQAATRFVRILPAADLRDGELIPVAISAGGDPVEHLESLRRDGATHLVIPSGAAEWFAEQPQLRRHVRSNYRVVAEQAGDFTVHSLLARRAPAA